MLLFTKAAWAVNTYVRSTSAEQPGKTERTILGGIVRPYQQYLGGIWAEKLKLGAPSSIVQAHSAVFPTACLRIPLILRLFSAGPVLRGSREPGFPTFPLRKASFRFSFCPRFMITSPTCDVRQSDFSDAPECHPVSVINNNFTAKKNHNIDPPVAQVLNF